MNNTQNWKRKAAAKISRMSPDMARSVLAEIDSHERSFDNPVIREMCGNSSQSINFDVKRMLGRKAGFCI